MGLFPSSGRYELGRIIGRGGFAVVYEALDRANGSVVAVKVLVDQARDEITRARFAREGRAARAIVHPNVCRTLDAGVLDDGRPYVAMERLHGETLRAHLKRVATLDAEQVIELGVQMLAGLEAAHERGVIHRDVKPDNVFIERRAPAELPSVKMLDFGICRRLADPIDDRTLTLAGCFVGTPGYVAPELAYGERVIDARTDLFAAGLVLYEALAGRRAYDAHDTAGLEKAFSTPLPPVSTYAAVPPALERVVSKATQHDPTRRYPTAAHFQHDLLDARTRIRRAGQYIPRPHDGTIFGVLPEAKKSA